MGFFSACSLLNKPVLRFSSVRIEIMVRIAFSVKEHHLLRSIVEVVGVTDIILCFFRVISVDELILANISRDYIKGLFWVDLIPVVPFDFLGFHDSFFHLKFFRIKQLLRGARTLRRLSNIVS